MARDIISIIIPVYNVQQYLDRCVKSVAEQSYPHLEIILVDDGSPDDCGRMCDEWARRDGRIRVIHKENGGLSDARNAGIDAAKGAYLMFIDSDDYISPDMVQRLYDALTDANADMSLCNLLYVDENGNPLPERNANSPIRDEVISGDEALQRLSLPKNHYYVMACGKLIKHTLFRDIRFPKGKIHEDAFATHHLLGGCKRIACVAEPCYFYVQRPGSIMQSQFRNGKSLLHWAEALFDRALYLDARGMQSLAGEAYISAVTLLVNYDKDQRTPALKEEAEALRASLKDQRRLCRVCSAKKRLKSGLFFLSPALYRCLARFIRRIRHTPTKTERDQ